MIKNKDFHILLIGRLITNFGDSLYSIAATLMVYEMSGSTLYSGFTLFLTSSTAIVQLLLSPILDHINMKRFLVASQLIQAGLILIIPFLYYTEILKVYHVMIIMPLITLINQLVYPGQISLLPKILDENQLVTGNSLFTMAYQGSNAIFDTIAGFIISALGFMAAFYIDSGTFLISALIFSFLSKDLGYYTKAASTNTNGGFIKDYLGQLKEGVSIFRDSSLFALLVGIVFINFCSTSISAVLPAFTGDEVFYSLMLAGMGAGILLGSLVASIDVFKELPLAKLYIFGILFLGIAWLVMSFCQEIKALAIALYGLGWFIVGIVNVYSQTMVQLLVPKNKIGLASGAMVGISSLLAPFGALFGGWIGQVLSSPYAIAIAAIIIVTVAIYWFFSESIRDLPAVKDFHQTL